MVVPLVALKETVEVLAVKVPLTTKGVPLAVKTILEEEALKVALLFMVKTLATEVVDWEV